MLTTVEIRPADGRKSFYGKATMSRYDGYQYWTVRSYSTDVALVCKTDEGMVEVTKLWRGYSHTSLRHINGAISMLGASRSLCKKDWEDIPYHGKVVVE